MSHHRHTSDVSMNAFLAGLNVPKYLDGLSAPDRAIQAIAEDPSVLDVLIHLARLGAGVAALGVQPPGLPANVNLVCPNCGNRRTLPANDWHNADGTPYGCGDCAQAGVRPRSLYGYVEVPGSSPETP